MYLSVFVEGGAWGSLISPLPLRTKKEIRHYMYYNPKED